MAQNTARKTDANRRDKPRLRSFMAATVLYNNGQSTLDCVIRNISEDGAKLALPAEVALPDRFDLAVPQRNKTYRATMAWRRGGEVGVSLEDASVATPEDAALDAVLRQRIRMLEAEIAQLKNRILQLTEG
jgi:uncharacterized protein YceH (UPF0502 family)